MATQQERFDSGWEGKRSLIRDPERTALLEAAAARAALTAVFDDRGRIVSFSPACEELTGYTFDEVCGRPHWEVLLAPQEAQVAAQGYTDRELASVPGIEETHWIGRDGTSHRLLLSQRVLTVPGSRDAYVAATGVVLTDTRGLGRAQAHAQRLEAIARLSESIAHDFNNLLSVINNYAEFLEETLSAGDPRHTDVEEIQRASERAGSLIRQFLTFSRRESGKARLVELSEVVLDMRHLLQSSVGEDIDVVTRLARGMWHTRIDPRHVEQILAILAVHARDVLSLGGRLTIETDNVSEVDGPGTPGGRRVCLAVTASGHGGSGLSLSSGADVATMSEIVSRWGGTVVTGDGNSSVDRIRIYLPATEASAAEGLATHANRGRGERIVLVEDEDALERLVKRILTTNGYEVETAKPEEALKAFTDIDSVPELLLTDVIMPGLSGRELAERVHKIAPQAKVVFMSGYTDEIIARHGVLEAGYVLLHKPFVASELLETVRGVLDRA
ncbi:MAG TPA: response regulator [Actinomycetota bacterium]|nr:response regulator [Actinomycetota bacterium]